MELVVHLEHRREVARGDALDFFDEHVVVVGVAVLEVLEQAVATVHETAHVRAHRHDELPHRLALEHRVEGARAEHERGSEVEQLRDFDHGVGCDPAVLILREVQQRQHRRLLVRIASDDVARLVEVGGVERH